MLFLTPPLPQGTVVGLGDGVTTLRVGSRVAIEPGVPCWTSGAAKEGRYNLDPDIKFSATPPVHGSLANFVARHGAFHSNAACTQIARAFAGSSSRVVLRIA